MNLTHGLRVDFVRNGLNTNLWFFYVRKLAKNTKFPTLVNVSIR